MIQRRLERLREGIAAKGLDALLVTESNNRRYMSGFTGSAGVLIISQEDALLATDFRYFDQVRAQAPDYELIEVSGPMHKALAETVERYGFKRLGFESQNVTVETYNRWQEAMPAIEWVATSSMVEDLREIKETGEIERITEAVRIADKAMEHIMDWIRPGMTERQVSWELEVYMRTHGAEKLSFTTIVASGPNGAMAHAVTTERTINAGDPVVIDTGAVYEGYCSDITRSFCVGEADDEYRAVWDTVLKAQEAAEAAIKAGMPGVEADAVARNIIYGAGYENKFGHGLGHGVGLAIHESPRASRTSKDVLKEGTVVTVEPGIYIPGWGGIRIEDMVVVTEAGCRVLTAARKDPVVGG